MLHLGDHAPRPQHLAIAYLGDRSNCSAGHACFIEPCEPFVARALLDDSLYQRDENIAVPDSVGRTRKSLVVRQLCHARRSAEPTPEVVICYAEIDPTIRGLESFIGDDSGVLVAPPPGRIARREIDAGVESQQ